MNLFHKALEKKVISSLKNNYGIENYDEFRFGKLPLKQKRPVTAHIVKKNFKGWLKKILRYYPDKSRYLQQIKKIDDLYSKQIRNIWDNISDVDRDLLVSIVAFRILGYRKVKLSRNNLEYWEAIETANTMADPKDTYDPQFLHFILKKFNLNAIGIDLEFYFHEVGVADDFILEQYSYKINDKRIVTAELGDIVLDLGACWGDTALYFANQVGSNGKVFSFEFIPDNLKLFTINTALNPILASRINLVENPVSDLSGNLIYFKDNGPGSRVKLEPFEDQTGTASTVSIDDFVKLNKVVSVDFIKMDIEGSEPAALEGALATIKKFRPKLAIAIYHSMSDFFNIPTWILKLDLDYEIYIGHYTIHSEETICFAKPKALIK